MTRAITDIGGPTANLYGASCKRWDKGRFCQNRHCLLPERCPNLVLGYDACIRLYKGVAKVPGVKHVFIGSGLRFASLSERFFTGSTARRRASPASSDHSPRSTR